MKEMIFDKILKKYSVIPLLSAASCNSIVYFGSRIVNEGRKHYILKLFLDDLIPFRTEFVLIYVLAYAHWIIGYLMIARESEEVCYRVISGDLLAKLAAGVVFILIPTTLNRPWPGGSGFWDQCTRLVFSLDAPDNLFPSIHCLESWMVYRGSLYMKHPPKYYRPVMLVCALLVFASTVFLKQHLVIDIAGGVLFAEAGLYLAKKFRLGRIFEGLNRRLLHIQSGQD